MAGQYVQIDISEMRNFVERMRKAGKGDLRKELAEFLDGLGMEFLRIVQDLIIDRNATDTRNLLSSFEHDAENGIYKLSEGNLTLEVGTNVEYASYVNNGHWLNPKGVETRFVPGHWDGERFIYEPGAKTGMLLCQKWVEGSHYWDDAINMLEKNAPEFMEAKIQQWLQSYFSM